MRLRYTDSMHATAAVLLGIGLAVALIMWGDLPKPEDVAVSPPPNALTAPVVRSWRGAARRVEETRGEPVGRAAAVEPPAEEQHDSGRRPLPAEQAEDHRAKVQQPGDEGGQ